MSNIISSASHAPSTTAVCTSKVPRERIVTLWVEADRCPQVLLRILGLIAQQATLPLSISAERSDEKQSIAIELDTLTDPTTRVLLAKIEAIVAVRKVDLQCNDCTDPSG